MSVESALSREATSGRSRSDDEADGIAEPPPTNAVVQKILDDQVGGLLAGHLGVVNVEDISAEGNVSLHFGGTCDGCPVLPVTFLTAVEPVVLAIRGVTSVSSSQMNVSKAATRRIRQLHHLPDPTFNPAVPSAHK